MTVFQHWLDPQSTCLQQCYCRSSACVRMCCAILLFVQSHQRPPPPSHTPARRLAKAVCKQTYRGDCRKVLDTWDSSALLCMSCLLQAGPPPMGTGFRGPCCSCCCCWDPLQLGMPAVAVGQPGPGTLTTVRPCCCCSPCQAPPSKSNLDRALMQSAAVPSQHVMSGGASHSTHACRAKFTWGATIRRGVPLQRFASRIATSSKTRDVPASAAAQRCGRWRDLAPVWVEGYPLRSLNVPAPRQSSQQHATRWRHHCFRQCINGLSIRAACDGGALQTGYRASQKGAST